ncbi:MAG: hypothetical protein A2Z88_03370 [Omnitrophica WOR_2 bacterium GWA2_47_8]|nr:MAG: hypothetical protein A2Z88_03370 [Omnitrophica WOR_2 bacterium GWA2_47_8]
MNLSCVPYCKKIKAFSFWGVPLFLLSFLTVVLAQTPSQNQPPTQNQGQNSSATTNKPSAGTAENRSAPVVANPLLPPGVPGKPIVIEEESDPLEDRLDRTITLDVREMNVIDVIKFLSIKGNFNLVTGGAIEGRVTLYLKNVTIRDAMDIILISNDLAYYVERGIIHVLTETDYQAMFGKRFNDKLEVAIFHLDYAKPSYALATLENLKSSLGKIVIDEDTGSVVMIDTKQALEEMKQALLTIEKPAEVVVYSIQFAKAEIVAEKLRARIDTNAVGSITTDERSNKLIVRAQPGRRKEVEEMIKSLDVPTKEVLIEVKVFQVILKPQFDFGIDWNLDFKSSDDPHIRDLTIKNLYLNDASPPSPLGSNFNRIAVGSLTAGDHFEMFLRSLKQVSDTKILSSPKLLVTNNEEAKIHVGDTVPYIISTTSGTGDNAITSEDVRFVDVGLKLNVQPVINDDGFVTMRLAPEISTVTAKVSSKGGGIPQINKTLVETSVMVKDGMTIILGGLKKDNKVRTEKGMPFLMDVPWLGNLFKYASDSIEHTEIVIFITPHIVYGHENYADLNGTVKGNKEIDPDAAPLTKGLKLKE